MSSPESEIPNDMDNLIKRNSNLRILRYDDLVDTVPRRHHGELGRGSLQCEGSLGGDTELVAL